MCVLSSTSHPLSMECWIFSIIYNVPFPVGTEESCDSLGWLYRSNIIKSKTRGTTFFTIKQNVYEDILYWGINWKCTPTDHYVSFIK